MNSFRIHFGPNFEAPDRSLHQPSLLSNGDKAPIHGPRRATSKKETCRRPRASCRGHVHWFGGLANRREAIARESNADSPEA